MKGYCLCPKLLNTHAIPLTGYPRNTLSSITYLLKLGEYCIALPKPKRDVIPSMGYTINTMG
jgi:hypothetical protein